MKYKILMPCFNDWASVLQLLEKIDNEVSNIDGEFDVIIVNDGSNEKMPKTSIKYKVLKSVKVINMKFNQGHTRSNATGIKYLSRKNLPFEFKKQNRSYYKHLSIISFKPSSLLKFCNSKETFLESIEGVELLRALELDMHIQTVSLKGSSFSVDVKKDFIKEKKYILQDKLFKKYIINEK